MSTSTGTIYQQHRQNGPTSWAIYDEHGELLIPAYFLSPLDAIAALAESEGANDDNRHITQHNERITQQ